MATEQWIAEHQDEMKAYRRKWYHQNKDRQIERQNKRRKDIGTWFKELKSTLSCQNCGENHPACLDFHHRNPEEKDFIVATMVGGTWGKKRILEEISKCDVLCANCHRKLHYEERI